MAVAYRKKNETVDQLIKRWNKKVEQEKILITCRDREYFKSKSVLKREKSKRAQLKALKEKRKENIELDY